MKKSGFILLAIAALLLMLVSFTRTTGITGQDPPQGIPDSVWVILETSCYDCHSNDGNGMARAKLNLDNWDEYPPDKQLAKAQDICAELQKEKMPPKKYRNNNPDAVPSADDVSHVCDWVARIEK